MAWVTRSNFESLKSRPPTIALIPPVALSMASSAPCAPESCSRLTRAAPLAAKRENLDVADVPGLENVRQFLLRPGDVGLPERGGVASKLHGGDSSSRSGHQRVDVSVHLRLVVPVGMQRIYRAPHLRPRRFPDVPSSHAAVHKPPGRRAPPGSRPSAVPHRAWCKPSIRLRGPGRRRTCFQGSGEFPPQNKGPANSGRGPDAAPAAPSARRPPAPP